MTERLYRPKPKDPPEDTSQYVRLAEWLKDKYVDRRTVYYWIKCRWITAFKHGGQWWVRKDSIDWQYDTRR